MDFLDSLKNIKKELQKEQKRVVKSNSKVGKSGMSLKEANLEELLSQNSSIKNQDLEDEKMKAIFLKEEKLQDEFAEFIKNSDIKKI